VATKPELPRIDPPPVDYSDLSPEMKRWLSDVTDIINQAFKQIEDSLP
jgi:hypothetical protein